MCKHEHALTYDFIKIHMKLNRVYTVGAQHQFTIQILRSCTILHGSFASANR